MDRNRGKETGGQRKEKKVVKREGERGRKEKGSSVCMSQRVPRELSLVSREKMVSGVDFLPEATTHNDPLSSFKVNYLYKRIDKKR